MSSSFPKFYIWLVCTLVVSLSSFASFWQHGPSDHFLWSSIHRLASSLFLWNRLLFDGSGRAPLNFNSHTRSYIHIMSLLCITRPKKSSRYRPNRHLGSVSEFSFWIPSISLGDVSEENVFRAWLAKALLFVTNIYGRSLIAAKMVLRFCRKSRE